MSRYADYLARKYREFGAQFDTSDLNPAFVAAFEHRGRITVSFKDSSGQEIERKRGTVGVTTGWKPAFLLVLTKRSLGSSHVIGQNDIEVAK